MDRMQWYDIDELYYSEHPSEAIRQFATQLRQLNDDLTGIKLVQDLSLLRQAIRLLGDKVGINEVIAIHSTALAGFKGQVTTDLPLSWLGYDIFSIGEFSLLRDGVYDSTGFPTEWRRKLNAKGLFDSLDECQSFSRVYLDWANNVAFEPIHPQTVDFIEVYRLDTYPQV
jgi:hypothetical protein